MARCTSRRVGLIDLVSEADMADGEATARGHLGPIVEVDADLIVSAQYWTPARCARCCTLLLHNGSGPLRLGWLWIWPPF
jgi:hypothetical protein